jgi:MFS family permease
LSRLQALIKVTLFYLMNLPNFFRFPPSLTPELRSNFIRYFWDIGWWGLYMGSMVAFLTIYAARIGATRAQIGLLTALPAFVSLVLSLPMGWWLKRISPKRATVWSAFIARGLFIVYVFLPWAMPADLQVSALLVMSVILAVPATVINISFSQLFMEAIPSEWRGAVVGARNAIMSIISFPVTLICGQVLTHIDFPYGYQVVFLIGFVGAVMTAYELNRVHPMPELSSQPIPALGQGRKFLPVVNAQGQMYIKVLGFLFLFNLTNNMVAPLVPDLLVNQLRLSDAWISVGTAVGNLLVFSVSLLIARLTRRYGNRNGTAAGAVLLAVQTVILSLAQDVPMYLAAAVVGGVASGILGAAQYNYHLNALPQSDRSTWLSWNLLLGNGAILLGALAGPAVANLGGTPLALVIFGALRLLFGFLIWLRG